MIPPNYLHFSMPNQQVSLYQHHRIEGVVT